MAALEPAHGSANSSQDSRESGGQKSMLELLSITDAAVKALNKSGRSTSSAGSQGSKRSHNLDPGLTDPLVQSPHSDRSAKSSQSGHSMKSVQSGQSMKSVQSGRSGQSIQSQKSSHSVRSHHSVHSSHSQEDNLGARSSQPFEDVSHDSGVISKTHTLSENKSKPREVTQTVSPEGASDVSTTASDILIQSTHDKSTRSIINEENGLLENISTTSKCSKTSFGVENFNSSGPQKVKISKRRLKEIKSPFEEEELRTSASSDEKVPSSLLSEDGRSKRGSRTNSERSSESKSGKSETGSQNGGNGAIRKTTVPVNQSGKGEIKGYNGAKRSENYPQGIDNEQFRVEKVRKSTEKAYEDINMVSKSRNNNEFRPPQPVVRKENGGQAEKNKPSNGALNFEPEVPVEVTHLRSTPKYFVERHTPQKGENKQTAGTNVPSIPERKNLLQDLEDSVEIITAHAKDMSSSSSQPEIITVQEKIVTVTAKDAGSPASTVSEVVVGSKLAPPLVSYHSAGRRLRDDRGHFEDEIQKNTGDSDVPPALPRQFKKMDDFDEDNPVDKFDGTKPIHTRSQWFAKQATGHGLLQGAPVSGHDAPDKHTDVEIHISDFKLTDKQRMVKESFAKRQGGPIRRVVQPRLVGHDSKASSTSSVGEQKTQQHLGQSNDQILTAAAAASAAVAATQPFLKAQYEMEAKMAELVEKINELQKGGGVKVTVPVEGDRVTQLERQLTEATERRIDYMEKLQEQQFAMQAKLLSLTRDASSKSSVSRSAAHSPESHIYIHRDSQRPATTYQNKAFSKTTVHTSAPKGDYSERIQKYSSHDHDESMSPLHTPAPRSRAPKPTMYDTSDIDYRSRTLSPKGRSPKARSPKTKARPRSKSPLKENQDHGILHQILASVHTPPSRDPGLHPIRAPVLQERSIPCHLHKGKV